MSLTKRDKNLLLIVFGLLIFVLVYILVFNKLNEKTDQLEAENRNLQTVIDRLNELNSNREFYEQETARYQKENIEIKNKYPSDIFNADKVLYAKKLEEHFDWAINYIGIGQEETVDAAYPEAEQISVDDQLAGRTTENAPTNPNGIYLFRHGVNMNFDAGYTNIKNALKYIAEDAQPKEIHTVSLAFNEETGNLSGNMDASMYSMSGTEVPYSRPDFAGISIGTDDIFKSFDQGPAAFSDGEAEREE